MKKFKNNKRKNLNNIKLIKKQSFNFVLKEKKKQEKLEEIKE